VAYALAARARISKARKRFGQNAKMPLTYASQCVTILLPVLQVYALIFLVEMGVLIVG
jgi:hypothetical protein